MSEVDRIKKVIPIMNEISPTFCMAKWHHTSIYLHTGQTHSCYHPRPHDISLDEIEYNPSALHNTKIKKQERALMLVGEKPEGCQYCWNVESLDGEDHISDRMIRNSSIYTEERFNEIKNNTWNYNINPEYIEVAFSNECNFKCGYCHPMSSTSYHSEIKQYGPYPVKNHSMDIEWFKPHTEDENPYVKAWWQWWPEMSRTLNILRITGGEPLMHRSTWRLFEELNNTPRPNLELNLNSNLGVKPAMVDKLISNVNDLLSKEKIKQFKLFTSMDTYYKRAEYLRTGLDLNIWEQNFHKYLTETKSPITFMCTFNILSVTSFTDFLAKILEWRKKYNHLFENTTERKIRFDTPYLKEPLQYDMHILPKDEFLPYFDKILNFIDSNRDENDPTKFSDLEYERFRRVRDYFAQVKYDDEKITEGRKDFYRWFSEYDKRRNVNFLETFPEMKNFWNHCQLLNNSL